MELGVAMPASARSPDLSAARPAVRMIRPVVAGACGRRTGGGGLRRLSSVISLPRPDAATPLASACSGSGARCGSSIRLRCACHAGLISSSYRCLKATMVEATTTTLITISAT
jgi:hypothetical protein